MRVVFINLLGSIHEDGEEVNSLHDTEVAALAAAKGEVEEAYQPVTGEYIHILAWNQKGQKGETIGYVVDGELVSTKPAKYRPE